MDSPFSWWSIIFWFPSMTISTLIPKEMTTTRHSSLHIFSLLVKIHCVWAFFNWIFVFWLHYCLWGIFRFFSNENEIVFTFTVPMDALIQVLNFFHTKTWIQDVLSKHVCLRQSRTKKNFPWPIPRGKRGINSNMIVASNFSSLGQEFVFLMKLHCCIFCRKSASWRQFYDCHNFLILFHFPTKIKVTYQFLILWVFRSCCNCWFDWFELGSIPRNFHISETRGYQLWPSASSSSNAQTEFAH